MLQVAASGKVTLLHCDAEMQPAWCFVLKALHKCKDAMTSGQQGYWTLLSPYLQPLPVTPIHPACPVYKPVAALRVTVLEPHTATAAACHTTAAVFIRQWCLLSAEAHQCHQTLVPWVCFQ
jgi:hypothetical protein